MSIRDGIKKYLTEKSPLAQHRLKAIRQEIRNPYMSLLCPNCIGGHIYHDLGLQFRSPTINLMIYQPEFVRFVKNLDYYLSLELEFFEHSEFTFPCAKLGDVTIHFTHYATKEEAAQKWYSRSERIDRNNLFVCLSERDGLTYEEISSLKDLNVRGLLVFTANEYPDIPYTVHIPKYKQDGQVGNILAVSKLDGTREYDEYFDFVKWFNEADGIFYDVSPYMKKKI